jgi:hypothetical protein
MIATRQGVVDAARSWLKTPYHHQARVKGHGVDCAQIIAAFVEAGCIEDFDPGFYTMDWHLHQTEERYLGFIERFLTAMGPDEEMALKYRLRRDPNWNPPKASVIVVKLGNTFSHGMIVTNWPNIIHSNVHDGEVIETPARQLVVTEQPIRVYDWKGFSE